MVLTDHILKGHQIMKRKHLLAVACIMAFVLAVTPMVVLALVVDTQSTPAGIYGTLTGTLSENGYYTTSVTRNPDSARLTISGLFQNVYGQNIGVQNNLYSARGARFFSGFWSSIPAGTYTMYGTHGVQGGTQSPTGYAVFTAITEMRSAN